MSIGTHYKGNEIRENGKWKIYEWGAQHVSREEIVLTLYIIVILGGHYIIVILNILRSLCVYKILCFMHTLLESTHYHHSI